MTIKKALKSGLVYRLVC